MTILKGWIFLVSLGLILGQTPQVATAQGKGGGKDKSGGGQVEGKGKGGGGGQAQGKGQGKGQGKAQGQVAGGVQKQISGDRGRSGENRASRADNKGLAKSSAVDKGKSVSAPGKFTRATTPGSMHQSVRRYATSGRARDVIVAAAVSHAFARGRGDDFRIEEVGNGMRVANRKGDPLVYLDDESARDLGRWRVGVVDGELREGAPSFCRSGAGHPVWGREWCIDKGFGLGTYEDYGWARTTDLGDFGYSRNGLENTLVGSALASVLGTTAFNRLALHAVTLGLVEPLVGRWVAEPTGPQVLLVNSGALPVAELVDTNRDNRFDDLLVALRSW